MANEDYELMSQKDIARLKKEIAALRKGGKNAGVSVLLDSMEGLNENITALTDVFKEATMELKLSDHDTDSKKLRELSEKVDNIEDQNEKIAEAILTIADLAKEIKAEVIALKEGDAGAGLPPPPEDFSDPFENTQAPPPPAPPQLSPSQPPQQMQGMPPPPPQGAPPQMQQGMQPPQGQGGLPPLQPPPFNPGGQQQPQKKSMFGFK